MNHKFSQSTIEALQYYVYLLEDPLNNKIFYIWKWVWNRIFSHIKWAIKWDEKNNKIDTIKNILQNNQIPRHKIIRHWLSEKEAFEVETALIDFYWINNLTNIVLWHHSKERWLMDINEVLINYEAKKIKIDDNLLIININNLYYYNISKIDLYEATRKSWRLNLDRVKNIKYALSVYKWIVREVYDINEWKFSKIINWYNRYEFIWNISKNTIRDKYIYTDVTEYFKKWSQNPIKYININ